VSERSAAEANRDFYAEHAATYDATEECLVDPRQQARLRDLIEHALVRLPAGARALDACGGSGNATLLLAEQGAHPVTVDVSPDMLALLDRKARDIGFEADTRLAPIEDFLREDETAWDLIVFSSALHHLEDPGTVLDLAAARLAPGGLLVTVFDPMLAGGTLRRIRRADYALHVLLKTPGRLPAILRRRGSGGESVGAEAERHALAGLDDRALDDRLRAAGLEIVRHTRYADARYGVTRAVLRLTRTPSAFSLVARRQAPTGSPER
jgi:ubiquinone/menaquinone biosynthesis C-methylase UbiE